jgi:hypothetical protein
MLWPSPANVPAAISAPTAKHPLMHRLRMSAPTEKMELAEREAKSTNFGIWWKAAFL